MYLYLDGEHPNAKQSRIDNKRLREKRGKTNKQPKTTRAEFQRKPKHTKAFLEASVFDINFD